jgi:nucleoside-diphosphate-sugar epimerase
MNKKTCIITGATGVIGAELSNFFLKKNWEVISLSKQKISKYKNFNLNNPFRSISYIKNNADLLIHCAYDFSSTSLNSSQNINIKGSKNLFIIAKKKGVKKIINISTLSAFNRAKSKYGKIKYKIEKIAEKHNVINLRLGLVVSKKAKLFNKIKKFKKYGFIVPLVGDGNFKLHLTKITTLNNFLMTILRKKKLKKIYFVCEKNHTTLKKLLINKNFKFQIFFKINLNIVFFILKTLNFLKINVGFTEDNLIGLVNYNHKITQSNLLEK